MPKQFERVAIVNRGEAAMRFIHAAREYSQEQSVPLHTIALFTEPDRESMFVREADEGFALGAARFHDPETQLSKSSYLDYARLEHALVATRAEAVWVGWGFVAEHAAFADLCRSMGIVFIGPSGDVMRQLGDKIAAKRLAEGLEIQVAPWSGGPVETISDALGHAETLGFPLLIKAAAGGGGRGIRRVRSISELEGTFESARSEAFKSFGDHTVFLERFVKGSRHVEVQIIADGNGTTWAVGIRDCSVQRRQQKIVEEAPPPTLSASDDRGLREAALRLAKAAGYRSAGTVEFLFEPTTHQLWFMEVNTRLQVEHPVTERTTGLDLVKLQIHIARGGTLEGNPPPTTGHAIEVRLNAEDAEHDFAAAPGVVKRFRVASGPGIRLDSGVAEGDRIPSEFDSMIAKLVGYGQTRGEALARLRRALHDSVIVVKGGMSNRAFLTELLNRPEIESGQVDIGWLDRVSGARDQQSREYADVALIQAAIDTYDAGFALEQSQFYASAARGRPHTVSDIGRTVALRYCGQLYALKTCRVSPQDYAIGMDGNMIEAHVQRRDEFESWLTVFGCRFHVLSTSQGATSRIEVNGLSHCIDRDDWGMVHAPAPAVVVSIAVKPGETVRLGDRLAVLEAMKMETQVVAPFSGRVRQVLTMPNVQVDAGAPLVQIEVTSQDAFVTPEDRITFDARQTQENFRQERVQSRCEASLKQLRQLLLGFDVNPVTTIRGLSSWSQTCPAESEQLSRAEEEILSIFVDICSLFHRIPNVNHRASAEEPAAETLFFSYLRLIETKGGGLPPWFVEALQRVLTHYGIGSLESTPELRESLLWICKSHGRMDQHVGAILNILERRLQHAAAARRGTDLTFRTLLERISAIARDLYPSISDLASEIRYRYFDQPVFERARTEVYDEAEKHLAQLAVDGAALDRQTRIRALVECPQLLAGLFGGHFLSANPALRRTMLEVLTGRYYRIRNLQNMRGSEVDGRSYVTAEYDFEGRRIHVFAIYADYEETTAALAAFSDVLVAVPPEHDIVVDLHLSKRGKLAEVEDTEAEVRAMVNAVNCPRRLRRIVASIAGVCTGQRLSHMQNFTYRPGDNGYWEETLYRGVHPMMGKRLNLWRLSNFDIQRLPSVEDVYVLHAIARENPKDERLFAAAEVRDVTPIRDDTGRIVQLPHLERMLMEALAAIRLYQSRRNPKERLYWNRVFLYVWPPLNLRSDELQAIVRRLLPATEGLGLEQVVVRARIPNPSTGELRDMVLRISRPTGSGFLITFRPADKLVPLKPLTAYEQKVIRVRQRGLIYPYEIIRMLTPAREDTRAEFPPGDFIEHDLDLNGRLVPVNRSYGENKANIIAGLIRNFTGRYPEGMERVLLLGDPSRDLGALAEAECRRIIAALDLAEERRVPLEWFPISAGAKISMESGVENMDWIAKVLRRLVEFTQGGGEVNLLINGINVGAQPYWNAEATMLMHTRGILVMTPKAAMVLTGKRALDYSGSVSAEDNQGIGGYDRIMGVNGQAQYWAHDINEACHILFRHYEHTYVLPGERYPRRAETTDLIQRDIRDYPHSENGDEGFTRVGEILSDETNPGRKKPFEIRRVMMAAIDQDHPPLERWAGMRAAETAVVWDAHLGGYPVCLVGIESRSLQRMGFVPADGPDQWSAGTLFPQSSKKVARAINAASNNRPVVVLANLSGFDGSPESMRRLQLEYGAEIGRAVVNFKGPIVFCVISRYHGGAYVVFSRALNEQLEVAALEGTYASVIGGAPAAAVVFAGEVEARTRNDERIQALNQSILQSTAAEKRKLRTQLDELYKLVYSEKLGEMANEFDHIHSVHRALRVGALDYIISPAKLRPYLVDALERGMANIKEADIEAGRIMKAA
jgi:acetyl/propionyl-CoA carboxylase alpha subunit/acetyl-CoA carboxylase carboxyltransferase component